MKILDIPELVELPDPAPYKENPSAFVDLALTNLFQYQSALLQAEYVPTESSIRWVITPRVSGLNQPGNYLVGVSPSLGSFRSVLACINARFSTNNIYGGFAMQFLGQKGRVHRCLIYTSNTGLSDFWVRVYSAVVDPLLWPSE